MKKSKYFLVSHKSLMARDLAISLMREHGLFSWYFAFNGRRSSLGLCRHPTSKSAGKIELSTWYCERISDEEIRETILHEIAHALVGPGHGHGPVWKATFLRIGGKGKK